MSSFIEEVERKLEDSGELTYDEFQQIRRLRERADDIEDRLEGLRSGIADERFDFKSITSQGFAIVVGHTNNRVGAYGTSPISQHEYHWNKHLAQMIVAECTNIGVESRVFYRDGIGISGAYKQVSAWGAQCVTELHFNAFNGSARGTETLYDGDINKGSKAWADKLQTNMLAALGTINRGLKERDPGDRGYKSLSSLNIPSSLIEPFFGDNALDAKIGNDNKLALAKSIADAAASQLSTS